ncbi:MAG: TlpA family protein disulfide reductase [Planctomycetota bacterium]|nr:MAG: TlpA family protein disulfide reductase [Planctomycetota bacterium]
MTEQENQKPAWPAAVVAIVILVAIVLWALVRPKSPEHSYTQDPNRPKPTINEILNSAETWGPAYATWIGTTAPDFTLTDVNGKKHKLSDYRGKDVMLIFWATWCKPCLIEIPHLIELRDTTSEDKLAMLAISYTTVMPPNTAEQIKDFVQQNKKINYTVLPADAADMPAPYSQVRAIPSSFFIDPEGKIKLATEGMMSLPEIRAILQAE